MAASLTESMPLMAMEANHLQIKKPAVSTTSAELFRPLQLETTTKSEAVASSSPQHGLQPARKKLATLEAQRVMTVLVTAIRRIELASVLPQLLSERRADLEVTCGADISRRLQKHDDLLDKLKVVKEDVTGEQHRTSSASSGKSSESNQREVDSALSEHSTSATHEDIPTADNPNDRILSPDTTRSFIKRIFCTVCVE